jgi:hypothetical protein
MNTFPCLTEFLSSDEDGTEEIKANLKSTILSHLDLLHTKCIHYFPSDLTEQYDWV